jgi:hypothetical protein
VRFNRQVTYGSIVASICPHKQEQNRICLTVRRDWLVYLGITSTQTASLTTSKWLFQQHCLNPRCKIPLPQYQEYFYDNTPMAHYEYMLIPLQIIPAKSVHQYALRNLAKDGWVYIKIQKDMPGLKQAGIIVSKHLQTHLAKCGYAPTKRTPALWKHHTCPITFALVVDHFGMKCVSDQHADHLINAQRLVWHFI